MNAEKNPHDVTQNANPEAHLPDHLVSDAELRHHWVQLHIDWHKRYDEGSDSVRLGKLQATYIRQLWYGGDGEIVHRAPRIDVEEAKKLYTDFEKHIDGIADSLAHAFDETKEEVLMWFV